MNFLGLTILSSRLGQQEISMVRRKIFVGIGCVESFLSPILLRDFEQRRRFVKEEDTRKAML